MNFSLLKKVVCSCIVCATVATGGSDLDSFRIAGTLLGVHLYWQRHDINVKIVADTLGWNELLTRYLPVDSIRGLSPYGVVKAAAGQKKQFYKVLNPSGISVAIINDLKYPMFFLTQWSGKIDLPDKSDFETRIEDENIMSHFLWETVDSIAVEKPSKTVPDFRLRFTYHKGGCSDYEGKENISLSRAQIMCNTGFDLRNKVPGYIPEQNMYRIVAGIFILVDAGKNPSKIIREIEKTMDTLHLDLSYKPPELKVVSR